MNNLPVFELRIDEANDAMVQAIALVEEPAIESDFLAFSKNQMNLTFSADDEKMELLGGAMVPDMLIYRKDAENGEYNVFFSKETIRQIAQVYFKNGFQKNINLDHTTTPAKSFVFQSYLVDSEKGMTSPKGLNLPDGSWVVGLKVTDKEVWADIKAGKRKGFSVEGVFQYFNKAKVSEDEQILHALQVLNKLIEKKKK